MKIAFLCNSLEPGKDGVGDYTRRLANELSDKGNSILIISVSDNFIVDNVEVIEVSTEKSVTLVRLPFRWPAKQRFNYAKTNIDNFDPDCISLQFVNYGYHPKGLPFGLGNLFALIGKGKVWHIMLHEIWVGIAKSAPLKNKVYGYFQKSIIKSVLKKIRPAVTTTSNILYQLELAHNGIQAEILPLFSNIPLAKINNIVKHDLQMQIGYHDAGKQVLVGIFGTLHPQSDLEKTIKLQLADAKQKNKELLFVSFGKTGKFGIKEFNRLIKLFEDEVKFTMLGELSPDKVSALLKILQIGISCVPFEYLGKSGVYAAMRLHGLPVLSPANDFIPEYENEIRDYNKILYQREPYKWDVKYVAKQFLNLFS